MFEKVATNQTNQNQGEKETGKGKLREDGKHGAAKKEGAFRGV